MGTVLVGDAVMALARYSETFGSGFGPVQNASNITHVNREPDFRSGPGSKLNLNLKSVRSGPSPVRTVVQPDRGITNRQWVRVSGDMYSPFDF